MRKLALALVLVALSSQVRADTTQPVSTLFLSFAKAAVAELKDSTDAKVQDAVAALSSLSKTSTENQAYVAMSKTISDLEDVARAAQGKSDPSLASVGLVLAALTAAAPLVGAPMDWFPRHPDPAVAALVAQAPKPSATYDCGQKEPCKRAALRTTPSDYLVVLLSRHQ